MQSADERAGERRTCAMATTGTRTDGADMAPISTLGLIARATFTSTWSAWRCWISPTVLLGTNAMQPAHEQAPSDTQETFPSASDLGLHHERSLRWCTGHLSHAIKLRVRIMQRL